MHADPGLALNCPRCGRRLLYVSSAGDSPEWTENSHLFSCPEHGGWHLGPETDLRLESVLAPTVRS